jgi:hypothetical protein
LASVGSLTTTVPRALSPPVGAASATQRALRSSGTDAGGPAGIAVGGAVENGAANGSATRAGVPSV